MTAAAPQPEKEWQNLFGVCAALGEDFGFNPLYLRVLFGGTLIFAPALVLSTYFGLGAVVVASRVLFPNRPRATADVVALPAKEEPVALPLAA